MMTATGIGVHLSQRNRHIGEQVGLFVVSATTLARAKMPGRGFCGRSWLDPPSSPSAMIFDLHVTNPDTGLSVVVSFAGLTTNTTISGDPEGVHTLLRTHKGVTQKI
jgi:hypothetical protein